MFLALDRPSRLEFPRPIGALVVDEETGELTGVAALALEVPVAGDPWLLTRAVRAPRRGSLEYAGSHMTRRVRLAAVVELGPLRQVLADVIAGGRPHRLGCVLASLNPGHRGRCVTDADITLDDLAELTGA